MWFHYVGLFLLLALVVVIAVGIKQKRFKLLAGTFAFIIISGVSFYASLEDYQEKRWAMVISDLVSGKPKALQ